MAVCGVACLLYTFASFALFFGLFFLSRIFVQRLGLDKSKTLFFENELLSLIHSFLSSVLLLLYWANGHLQFADQHREDDPGFLILAFSLGYFLYDTISMKYYRLGNTSIYIHHIVIPVCFLPAMLDCLYAPYLASTLIPEVPNVFLHVRRLSKIKTGTTPYSVSLLLFLTNFPLRLFIHIYVFCHCGLHPGVFDRFWHQYLAMAGMAVINYMNVDLMWTLWHADCHLLFGVGSRKGE